MEKTSKLNQNSLHVRCHTNIHLKHDTDMSYDEEGTGHKRRTCKKGQNDPTDIWTWTSNRRWSVDKAVTRTRKTLHLNNATMATIWMRQRRRSQCLGWRWHLEWHMRRQWQTNKQPRINSYNRHNACRKPEMLHFERQKTRIKLLRNSYSAKHILLDHGATTHTAISSYTFTKDCPTDQSIMVYPTGSAHSLLFLETK